MKNKGKTESSRGPISRIAILIPAHNEEKTLPKSLGSIQETIRVLKEEYPAIGVDLLIGADGCSDRTEEIARSFGARVLASPRPQGKWKTLHGLLQGAEDAEWVVLADAGILWPAQFLSDCIPYCENPDNIGVAPTYRNPSAGWLETKIWELECFLKSLENLAGGPVSVHGPTVLFRRAALLETYLKLTASQPKWINDDVAISLSLRLSHPERKIAYLTHVASFDCPESHLNAETGKPIREFARRKRMVLGNLQWISSILLPRWKENPIAALVSCRRIFRLTWAYWMIAAALAIATGIGPLLFAAICMTMTGLAMKLLGKRPIQMLIDAGVVSISSPYYLISGQNLTRWK